MNQYAAGDSAREAKARLRALARDRLSSLPPGERREADCRIRARLGRVLARRSAGSLLAYRAMADEVEIEPFLCEMAEKNWDVFLPRVDDHGVLRLARWRPGIAMSRDGAGVLAPTGVALEDPRTVGGTAVVPGRAFDSRGGRLGRGRGFFDRLLAEGEGHWLSVGVAYECQVFDAVPREAHDRNMDALVTERSYRIFGDAGEGR